jgi:hypothetical protein
MTDSANRWRLCEAAVDADPELIKLVAAHTHQVELVRKTEQELRAATYKLQRVLLARDVVQRHAWNFESVTEEQEAAFKLTNGDDSEAWFAVYDGAADDMTDWACQLCGQIAQLHSTLQNIQAAREKAWDVRHAKATALRKAWHAANPEPAVDPAG